LFGLSRAGCAELVVAGQYWIFAEPLRKYEAGLLPMRGEDADEGSALARPDADQPLEERTGANHGRGFFPESSRTNRFLPAITDVASVIVPPEPSTLLSQACSKPSRQGTLTTSQALGMHPAQAMLPDVELSGVMVRQGLTMRADNRRAGQDAVRLDAAHRDRLRWRRGPGRASP
jgi:hypothetical protein